MQILQKLYRVIVVSVILLALSGPVEVKGQGREFGGRYLEAQNVFVLSPAVSGVITEIAHKPQEFVKKDDLLMQLDADLVNLQIRSLESQIKMNRSIDVVDAEIRLEYAKGKWEILKKLYRLDPNEFGGSRPVAEMELKEAKQLKDLAELGRKRVDVQWEQLGLELEQNIKILQRHSMRAPMDGVVVPFDSVLQLKEGNLKKLEVGEMVQTGQPVLAVMKVDRLRINKTLSKTKLPDVWLGQPARIFVEGAGDEPLPAEVVYISPTIETTQTFFIKVEFDNPLVKDHKELPRGTYRYRFRPGLEASIELEWEKQ